MPLTARPAAIACRAYRTTTLPNNQTALTSCTAAASTDKITKSAHGLVDHMAVVLSALTGGTGLSAATYYVINKGTDDFQVATTMGGSAVDITGDYSSLTVTPSAWQAVALDSEDGDPYGMHNTSTLSSRIVAPVAGYYQVTGKINAPNPLVYQIVWVWGICVNGSTSDPRLRTRWYSQVTGDDYNGKDSPVPVSGVVKLAANDYVELTTNMGGASATAANTIVGKSSGNWGDTFLHVAYLGSG